MELPEKFTFPFYYTPHPLALAAAEDLQQTLQKNDTYKRRFSSEEEGKMFGVLVVGMPNGTINYLAAYSGKLLDTYNHEGFVPPLYDMLDPTGFFKQGEAKLNDYSDQILERSNSNSLAALKKQLAAFDQATDMQGEQLKALHKQRKEQRKQQRTMIAESSSDERKKTLNQLAAESSKDHFEKKDWRRKRQQLRTEISQQLDAYLEELNALKTERAQLSAHIQNDLFQEYNFLNAEGNKINVTELFEDIPPAGTGECAAPKLLQFAYAHQLKPIALAEFWWGNSPQSAIRKHRQFYPACKRKCEPVLTFMLQGLTVDANPLLQLIAEPKQIEIIFEDEDICVVNKPADLLSVPGKEVQDSVLTRMQNKHPEWTGPIIVHRLDFSTSGLLILAKHTSAYQALQAQFITRTVQKRYCALLDGKVDKTSGIIELPLRVDLDDRPRQLVCHQHGKTAQTRWTKVSEESLGTLVHFYPITGRTHQLRVHAAHPQGLNTAIKGDELYGKAGERLFLHADFLQVQHPKSQKTMKFKAPCPF